jgi:hypothetical protein
MTQLVADARLESQLGQLAGEVEIVTASGRKLGRFIPETAADEPLIPWDPSITEEEIDRIIQQGNGRSLSEIWQRLGRR